MGAMTAAFAGTAAAGHYTDAAGLASGLAAYAGKTAGALFAVALLDAAMIGAFAVSLSTAYALGDVLGLKHSLHRGARQAKGFYVVYAALIAGAAAIVLIPGSPLGLLIEGVQVLAGVLLPSATVFLLLLCNDKAVLGPWVNGRWTNAITGVVISLLITLSLVLTASVAIPHITAGQIGAILAGCAAVAAAGGGWLLLRRGWRGAAEPVDRSGQESWRMPRLVTLTAPPMSSARKIGMTALRVYLGVAIVVVVIRIVQVAAIH
jgi:hypothetical protein